MHDESESDESDGGVDLAFASMDFSGVNFDNDVGSAPASLSAMQQWEEHVAFQDFSWAELTENEHGGENGEDVKPLRQVGRWMANGNYLHVLSPDHNNTAHQLFSPPDNAEGDTTTISAFLTHRVKRLLIASSHVEATFLQLELVAVASFNLFCQANYTGPTLKENKQELLAQINPHIGHVRRILEQNTQQGGAGVSNGVAEEADEITNELSQARSSRPFQNAVLSELAVDGEWPCPVCDHPYFLLVARVLLEALHLETLNTTCDFMGVHLWHARALVAHLRLLQTKSGEAPISLTQSLDVAWGHCTSAFATTADASDNDDHDTTLKKRRAATVWLERGLAEHHLDRIQQGRDSFRKAQALSGLVVEVTGSVGKRTKFQQEATAQLLVRAQSKATQSQTRKKNNDTENDDHNTGTSHSASNADVSQIKIEHPEDGILLDRVHYTDDKENEIHHLCPLDQCILLALCLYVQSTNAPARQDVLTAEEMGAFLARVLDHHDDWMIYSTALLERAWIEFERSHAKERAMLQMQALCDQHSNRLTLTQSTQKSVTEDSAPVQRRLLNLHSLVYPPRWGMQQEIADRYASLGMVTSAAELYTEIELWDEVVECYSRAGKRSKAEAIVRERLKVQETPRMWTALGELTKDADCYQKAIDLSKRRFAKGFIALAQHHFDEGNLPAAMENYNEALQIRPLLPHIWFRVGTIAMRLEDWEAALRAFSEVVQQEPEEAEAWANVAAVHLRRKNPSEAYPALNESLKYQRNNWRVWISKLYTCLDLEKWDDAIQAANVILDLRLERAESEGVPPLEEKCLRAIVGGAVRQLQQAQAQQTSNENSETQAATIESARRTLLRCHGLLDRVGAASSTMPWVFECLAFLHEAVGADEKVLEYLMQEFRALQAIAGWEREADLRKKMYSIVSHIVSLRKLEGSKESLVKSRMLVRGVKKKIEDTTIDTNSTPVEVAQLTDLLADIEAGLDEMS